MNGGVQELDPRRKRGAIERVGELFNRFIPGRGQVDSSKPAEPATRNFSQFKERLIRDGETSVTVTRTLMVDPETPTIARQRVVFLSDVAFDDWDHYEKTYGPFPIGQSFDDQVALTAYEGIRELTEAGIAVSLAGFEEIAGEDTVRNLTVRAELAVQRGHKALPLS